MKKLLISTFLVLAACANSNCRENRQLAGVVQPPVKKENDPMSQSSPADHARVYKADGSLQCKQGDPIAVADMQKQLGPITVYSGSKRHDTLMRVQVCGAATGQANVYEINRSDLPAALKAGFKEWTAE